MWQVVKLVGKENGFKGSLTLRGNYCIAPTFSTFIASTKKEINCVEELQLLIQRCIKGDRNSQNELYTMFSSRMFIVCLRYSPNRQEAEDNLQEGYLKAFEYLHQFKFTGSFEGWLRKIMVNCCLQKYRSKKELYAVVDIDTTSLDEVGNEDIISHIGTKELLRMVQKLPNSYRMVFNLYVFEGKKHREIAEELGISEGTSKSNLFDARTILQRSVSQSLQIAKQSKDSSL
jgi:RNA polymerase sigma-70 factor (ECF subfamily)